MSSSKLVTVVIPVYNTEALLERCLLSLVDQSFKDIEIFCINDGSTDKSFDILREYEKRYPDMVFVFNKKNGGQAAARNLGIDHCKTSYIMFVDSDDWVESDYIKNMVDAAKKANADIVCCDYFLDREGLDPEIVQIKMEDTQSVKQRPEVLVQIYPSPWCKLFKTKLFANLRFPTGMIYEDLVLIPIAISKASTICKLNIPLYHYFVRQGSTMTSKNDKIFDYYKAFDLLNKKLCAQFPAETEGLFYIHTVLFIRRLGYRSYGRTHIKKAIAHLKKTFPDWSSNKYVLEDRNKSREDRLIFLLIKRNLISALTFFLKLMKYKRRFKRA